MQRKISTNTVLTGIFVVLLFFLFFYGTLKNIHPAFDRLFMLFGQTVGLAFLVLTVFCIIGLVLLIIRRLYGFWRGGG
jgi:choline-glycine betaine transporter